MRHITAVGVVLAVTACAASFARADVTDDAFSAAVDAMSREQFAEAAARFVALAKTSPKHRLADDALFAAGKLYEERLGDPQRALELYRRLLRDYSDSRESLAAKRRADELVKGLGRGGEGAKALAAYTNVLQRFHLRSETESIRRMEALIEQHPAWAGIPKATLWLGMLHERNKRLSAANKWYLAAIRVTKQRSGDPDRNELLFNAYRGAGDVATKREQFSKARSYYQQMPVAGDPSRVEARKQLLANLSKRQRRADYYFVALISLLLLAAAGVASVRLGHESWLTAGKAMLRPPTEVVFMLPVAAVLTFVSFAGHHPTAKAVTIISLGGIAIAWLNGVGTAGPTRSRRRSLLHVFGSCAAVISLCYIALHLTGLIDQMVQALRLGPDVG